MKTRLGFQDALPNESQVSQAGAARLAVSAQPSPKIIAKCKKQLKKL
jgi:hypothetical protein